MKKVDVEFEKQPLISHLIELRNRILLTLIVIFAVFLVIIPFSGTLYLYISEPIRVLLADDITMIATEVASPFLTPFKLALIASIFLTMPHSLYQTWAFLAPGLYKREENSNTSVYYQCNTFLRRHRFCFFCGIPTSF